MVLLDKERHGINRNINTIAMFSSEARLRILRTVSYPCLATYLQIYYFHIYLCIHVIIQSLRFVGPFWGSCTHLSCQDNIGPFWGTCTHLSSQDNIGPFWSLCAHLSSQDNIGPF